MVDSEASSKPSLLPELYKPIAESLAGSYELYSRFPDPELKALCALAQTCRAFQYEAERIIFRDLLFIHHESCPPELMDALQTRKSEYVESITIIPTTIDIQKRLARMQRRGQPLAQHHISYTELPFDRMKRLRSIEISETFFHTKGWSIDRTLFQILHDKLSENTLHTFSSSLVLKPDELQFLLRQSNLIDLRLPYIPDHLTLVPSPTFVPRLEKLTIMRGGIGDALEILRTRPIKSLVFDCFPGKYRNTIPPNTLETLRLTYPGISHDKTIQFLESRTRDCADIQILSFRLSLVLDSHSTIKRNILSPLLQTVGNFERLQALHIHLDDCYISQQSITEFFIDRTSSDINLPPRLQTVLLVCEAKEINWSVEIWREEGTDVFRDIEGTERWNVRKTVDQDEWMGRWKNW
ncbi:hypothetical protein SISSUDRAFT_1062252 [Sistotremastrum suecicum HHB10207 ss-3]|uniref:F-box domain-containing protein n=1 Tax=Sistotremastrum suecicum HHB10207 ss-3 TaxID=1314776 RepID=A0A166D4R1_9AGAM|nr:hypothetical protein SISSUDRAFT_1062252 [Sistotremastrum suecicum HHB10207 ss-3]